MVKYCGNCGHEYWRDDSVCARCMMEPFREWVPKEADLSSASNIPCDQSDARRQLAEWWLKEKERQAYNTIGQSAKADAGKLELDLVPMQIVEDIAQVRMYGNAKYGDPDNWKTVEMRRYINALLRHLLAFLKDNSSVDKESGIEHYKHMACNLAFICEMMEEKYG